MSAKITRKQEILEAALQCFDKHGFDETTVEMIREASEASIGSMYHHFRSKQHIAQELYSAALAEHFEYQQKLLSKADNASEGVRALVYAYVDWVAANPKKAKFVLYSRLTIGTAEQQKTLQEKGKQRVLEILRWFEPLINAGKMKRLPLECYSSLITGAAHDYARLWLSGRVKSNIKTHRELFADAAWNAVKP